MVGEYVGHPDLQHLVRYERETIIFYALSKHDQTATCIPILQSYDFFQRHSLDYVKCVNAGCFRVLSVFYGFLEELFRQMASESLEEGEEGSVIYFASTPEPTNEDAEN
jgi:hypothetical protein